MGTSMSHRPLLCPTPSPWRHRAPGPKTAAEGQARERWHTARVHRGRERER